MQNGFEDDAAGVSTKGKRARRHFVEDDAEGKEIAASVEIFAADLFGRHVGDGAERAAWTGEMLFPRTLRRRGVGNGVGADGRDAGNFGEAEVENFRAAALGDEDVGGFYIAVDDSGVVGGVEGVGAVDADFEEAFEFERVRGDEVLERGAVEKFHGDEGAAVVFADVVDGADVGMVQRGGGTRFTLESFERLRIVGEIVGKKFESDEAAEARVFGFVDDAHSATAEFFDDAVVRNCLADEGGGVSHQWWEILWVRLLGVKCGGENARGDDELVMRRNPFPLQDATIVRTWGAAMLRPYTTGARVALDASSGAADR